jgi:hypothetical protein
MESLAERNDRRDRELAKTERRRYVVSERLNRAWNDPWKWNIKAFRNDVLTLEVNHQDDAGKSLECGALESRGFKKKDA